VSNEEWMSPTDPESRIGKMKDGRTHLLYKAEHVVDLGSEVVLAAPVYPGDEADVDTMVDSVMDAQTNLSEAGIDVEIEEAAADKATMPQTPWNWPTGCTSARISGAKAEGNRNWRGVPEEKRRAVVNNRRRTRGARSKRLQRLRSELVERNFAHMCDTGRCPAELVVWDREGAKALPACRRGPQPGPDHAQGLRNGHAEGLAGRGRPCFFCLFCLASRSS